MIDGSNRDAFFTRYDTIRVFQCWESVDYIPGIFSSGIIIPTKDTFFSMAIYLTYDNNMLFGRINYDSKTTSWYTLAKNS